MMLAAVVLACGVGAAGVLLIVRGLVGSPTPLATVVAELHRPRGATASPRPRTMHAFAGKPSPSRDADLAVCGRDVARWVQDRAVWTGIGVTPGVVLLVFVAVGLVSSLPITVPATVVLLGGTGGWLWARADLASDAARARREFRHALASYLQLVTILMAGGAGVETALYDAASVGTGTAFAHLRSALAEAQARREPPWHQLGALGARLAVLELEELQSSMTLAGGGAQVRDSLAAKAQSLAAKDLAEVESAAQARSETMVLPVALMFAGFLLLLGYPALSALSSP